MISVFIVQWHQNHTFSNWGVQSGNTCKQATFFLPRSRSFGDVYRYHVDRWPKMPRRIHRHRWQLVMSKQEAFIPNWDKFQRNDSWNKQTKSSLEWFLYVFTHCANRVPFYPRRRHSWPSQLEAKVVVTIVKKLVLFGSKIMKSLKINKNALAYSATTLAATMMNSVFNFYYVKTFLNVYK